MKKCLIPAAFVCIILAGIALRIYFYALGRSLWYDEVRLAYNIVNRSFLGLFHSLDYGQVAPPGFLFLEKAVVSTFGAGDYMLRLLPLVAGVASVPLMFVVSRRFGEGVTPFVALGLFALSERLIRYASELKQYSTDVLVALVLIILASRCFDTRKTGPLVLLACAGVVSMWLSHPSLFILAGIGVSLALDSYRNKDGSRFLRLSGIACFWCLNLIVLYIVSLRYASSESYLIDYWRAYFMPWPPWANMGWHLTAWMDLLRNPARLPPLVFTLVIVLFGWISLWYRRWQWAVILTVAFLTVLLASAMEKYPFGDRLMLFSLPLLFFLVAEGIERIRLILKGIGTVSATLAWVLLSALFLLHPLYTAYSNVIHPMMGEDIKPVMAYLSDNRTENDSIYVYYGARPAFQYYAPKYGFTGKDYIVGAKSKEDPVRYLQDIDRLSGSERLWVVFSHNCTTCVLDERLFILLHLNRIGKQRDVFKSSDSSVYLYDFKK